MTKRTCNGQDADLLMYLDIDGRPTDVLELAIEVIPCDCGSVFDEAKHDLMWPHCYRRPSGPARFMHDLPDIAGYL